ncbi:MAG TPA: terminase family protein [Chloroflexota bacterium]|nr:terminase family protein [Chloroflexota bacterium]
MGVAFYLPQLRPDQWRIVAHPAKVKVVCMGRRWGKTIMSGAVALSAASQGAKVMWMVPTYKNARPIWRWSELATAPLVKRKRAIANKTERTIDFPESAGFLGIYSADNDVAARGDWFNLAILDEASRIPESTWTDVVQPALADAAGDAILPSTPQGQNWYWREWTRGLEAMKSGSSEIAAFRAPTADNPNPRIQRAAELAKERVSERTYRQEWLAEFLEDGNSVLRNVTKVSTGTPQPRAVPGHEYVMGCDWGRSNDFTVFSVWDMTSNRQAYLDRFSQTEYAVQVSRFESLFAKFKPLLVVAEYNSIGGPLVELLQRKRYPVHGWVATNASKVAVIDAYALGLEGEAFTLLDDPIQKAEHLAFEATRLPSGMLRYAAPAGQHDDTVIAAALAYQATLAPRAGGHLTWSGAGRGNTDE